MSQLAIYGGLPVRKDPFPAWPVTDHRDIAALSEVVQSGQWGGFPYPGPQTARFLDRFQALLGGGFPVAVLNGTITMEVALRAAGIGWGDEVIVPAYTFQATAAAPMAAGAIPVIVDIDPDTYCISPEAIRAAITPKTRAIIPVHVGAHMADMDAIMQIAEDHNLVVIEDCAHVPGSAWRGRSAGLWGHFGSFSLQSFKLITSGEGGVLVCRTADMAALAASIVDCGRPHDPDGVRYTMGANLRMTEFQSALANVSLDRFHELAEERAENAAILDQMLAGIPGIGLLRKDQRQTSRSYYRYVFGISPQVFGIDNHRFCQVLQAEGIPCYPGYDPMHQYPLFQPMLSRLPVPSAFPEYFQFDRMHLPVAERVGSQEGVWLYESVLRAGAQGVEDVARAVEKILLNKAEL